MEAIVVAPIRSAVSHAQIRANNRTIRFLRKAVEDMPLLVPGKPKELGVGGGQAVDFDVPAERAVRDNDKVDKEEAG